MKINNNSKSNLRKWIFSKLKNSSKRIQRIEQIEQIENPQNKIEKLSTITKSCESKLHNRKSCESKNLMKANWKSFKKQIENLLLTWANWITLIEWMSMKHQIT